MPDDNYVGLFGYLAEGGKIKNLNIEDVNIAGNNYIGGLVGINNGGLVIKSSTSGFVSGNDYTGGLVGANADGVIMNSFSTADVTGIDYIGGLVGYNGRISTSGIGLQGTIIDSFSSTNITGNNFVGGIAGVNYMFSAISGCYATGEVLGNEKVGGLAGYNFAGEIGNSYSNVIVSGSDMVGGLVGSNLPDWQYHIYGEISRCYSAGLIIGDANTGGLVGIGETSSVELSFWDLETSLQFDSAGGQGLLTSEMQDPNTFINAGWDFNRPVWYIEENNYPEIVMNEPNCSEGTIADHVFEIGIETGLDYEEPNNPYDTEYEFNIEIDTDSCIEYIEFITPAGKTFGIPKMSEQEIVIPEGEIYTEYYYDVDECTWEWGYGTEFNDIAALEDYGDGLYTIIFYFQNGREEETTVWFGLPNSDEPIPQVVQVPAFTSIVHGDVMASPVSLSWESPERSDINFICLDLENQDTYEEIEYDFDNTVTSLDSPILLNEGSWEFYLGFQAEYNTVNADGIEVWCGKWSESDYELTIEE